MPTGLLDAVRDYQYNQMSSSRPVRPVRLALDMSERAGAAPREDIDDSDDELDVCAMAYPNVPPISEPNSTEGMRIPSSAQPMMPVASYIRANYAHYAYSQSLQCI
jgi:hypothetical protein